MFEDQALVEFVARADVKGNAIPMASASNLIEEGFLMVTDREHNENLEDSS
jgi:hypothetical protein